jgi:enoyl-CoA hydratase
MGKLVAYRLDDSIATITMDDGKVNVLSPMMLAELNVALDRALADRAVVVLTGREGIFSAGFDLSVLRSGGPETPAMLGAGFLLAERILSFPTPVIIACNGHAIAMGVFLLLSGDYRFGAAGAHKITSQRGSHRPPDPAHRRRDLPAAAGAGPFQQGRDPGRGLLAR